MFQSISEYFLSPRFAYNSLRFSQSLCRPEVVALLFRVCEIIKIIDKLVRLCFKGNKKTLSEQISSDFAKLNESSVWLMN